MSDDFFNQSFTPARSATIKSRPNARPPPPPPGQKRPSTNATSNVTTRRPTSSSTTSSSSNGLKSSGGYYANKSSTSSFPNRGNVSSTASNKSNPYGGIGSRSNMSSSRPTGNYYPTSSNDTLEKPATFQGYNPNPYGASSTEANTASAAPSLYGNSSNNATAAPNPYGNLNQSATTDSTRTIQTSNINNAPNAPSNDGDDWFSSAQQEDYNASQGQATSATAAPSYMNPYANTATINNNGNNYDQVPKRTESVEMMSESMSGPLSGGSNPSIFNPSMTSSGSNNDIASSYNPLDFENEPPLLEELGINIDHIKTKSLAVLFPMKYAKTNIDHEIMEDSDLAGPLAFGLILATELLLAGKMQFGYIYGFGLFGCLATTLVLNLMSPKESISVWQVTGILGYSLLPVNMLAAMNVFYRIKYMGTLGVIFATVTIIWCTLSSTRLVERGCEMRDQRYLIGYPISLLYSAFVMLTIF